MRTSRPAGAPRSVTVVVVTWNSAAVLPGLLTALPAAMADVEDWELVVADNDSGDDTVEVVRTMAPSATIVPTGRNAGYAAGINAAVARSRPTDAVLVVNPDTRPGPGTVRRLLEVLADPGTGIAAPRLVNGEGVLIRSLRRDPTVLRMLVEAVVGGRRAGRLGRLGEVVHAPGEYERENVADWVSGPFLLVARRCWDDVGPWDESFFLYSEETEFAMRVRAAGLLVRYTPTATVVHLEGEARQSPGLYSLQVVNRWRLYARHHSWAAGQVFRAVALVRELVRSPFGPTHRAAVRALVSPPRPSGGM